MAGDSLVTNGTFGDGSLGQLTQTYYQPKAESRLFQNLVLYNLGQKRKIPKNSGQVTQFYRYGVLNGSTATISSSATVNTTAAQSTLTATTISLTSNIYGSFVTLAKYDVNSIRSKTLIEDAVDVLADAASDTVDLTIRTALYANTATTGAAGALTASLYYGQDLAKTTATITTADTMTAGTIRRGVMRLQSNKVRPFEGQRYGLVVSPQALFDIMSDTNTGGFLASAQYQEPNKIWKGEVGMIAGARVVMSQNMTTASVTSGVTAYNSLLVGQDAFACVDLEGGDAIQIIIKKDGGSFDPLDSLVTVAYKLPYWGVAYLGADGPRAIRLVTANNG
jgi:N4-gp56 family major capsid protein